LIDFFDQNMLQLFDFERFLFDQVIPPDRKALYARRVIVAGKVTRMTHLRLQREYPPQEAVDFSAIATTKSATARNLSGAERWAFGLDRTLGRSLRARA
jgi:hypothetical protein